jgi:hypothetical protein
MATSSFVDFVGQEAVQGNQGHHAHVIWMALKNGIGDMYIVFATCFEVVSLQQACCSTTFLMLCTLYTFGSPPRAFP